MTIDSTWLHAFKEELPHAFTKSNPFHHSAVFIDGQIRLMQSPPKEPQTWDQFIFRQYARHIGGFLERCDTVVLAFDNYEHVPLAKCMTQVKRPMPLNYQNTSLTPETACRSSAAGTCPSYRSANPPSSRAWSQRASAG